MSSPIVRKLPKPWTVPEIMRTCCPTGAVAIDIDGEVYFFSIHPYSTMTGIWILNHIYGATMPWRMPWSEAAKVYGSSIGDPPTLEDAGGDWLQAIWLCTPPEKKVYENWS